ncbi:MAG: hypothetical protein OXI25_06405 [Chloroflexota bacterium]|nr:hypothetical protein [Chloroflexota bacterium]
MAINEAYGAGAASGHIFSCTLFELLLTGEDDAVDALFERQNEEADAVRQGLVYADSRLIVAWMEGWDVAERHMRTLFESIGDDITLGVLTQEEAMDRVVAACER